jgi:NADPH:quinone reductase-like Zn-dependent oxidoreductase
MKAIVYTTYGSPDVLELRELEKPVPKDDEVLIRIHAASVTATDTIFRKGRPFIARSATGLLRPKNIIPGDVLSGEIVALGSDVRLFKTGDQVFGSDGNRFGAHAEYKCLPEKGALAIKPANMTHAEAVAVVDGALTALSFLRDTAKVQRGQKILINGASGSIGTFAVQLARYYGADVTGVCSTTNVERVKSLGAHKVIDYTREDFTRTDQAYDIIFDTVGKCSFARCKRALKQKGLYLSTVLSMSILFQMLWTSRMGAKKALIAFTGLRAPDEKTADLIFLRELIEAGLVSSVIDRRYSLEQIAAAHGYVEKGHKKGSVVITLSGNGLKY